MITRSTAQRFPGMAVAPRLEPPLEAPRSQDQLGPVLGEVARGGFAQPAARTGDDDHLVLDALCHCFSFTDVGWSRGARRENAASRRSAVDHPLRALGVPRALHRD